MIKMTDIKQIQYLNREKTLREIQKYFKIHEFVGRLTYKIFGQRAWMFFSTNILKSLLIVRIGLNKSITVNNWFWGGKFSQRGLRTIFQQIAKNAFYRGKLYLSPHLFARAFDFDVKGMKANKVRTWIVKNGSLFPEKIRLEKTYKGKSINWVHMDDFWEAKNPKVYLFAA
jgi:hypothetical protein